MLYFLWTQCQYGPAVPILMVNSEEWQSILPSEREYDQGGITLWKWPFLKVIPVLLVSDEIGVSLINHKSIGTVSTLISCYCKVDRMKTIYSVINFLTLKTISWRFSKTTPSLSTDCDSLKHRLWDEPSIVLNYFIERSALKGRWFHMHNITDYKHHNDWIYIDKHLNTALVPMDFPQCPYCPL